MPEYRLVKHRKQWSLAYGNPRRRIATGTADRGRAEAIAGQIWRRLVQPKSERVADLWPPYVADRATTPTAKARSASLWKTLEPSFGYKLGKAITRADCRAYTEMRRRLGRSNSTIRTELEALRACLRWHYGSTAPQITAPQPSKPRERYLSKDEAETLLRAIQSPHVRLFVEIALGTGARMGAILDLTWDRVTDQAIDFKPAGRDITNKRRTVVGIPPRLREALKEARDGALSDYVIEYSGKPVASVKRAIASAARRSGVPCSPHVFRRTAAVWMAMADVPMDRIAQVLGHTSTRITYASYARYSPRFMADAIAALDW